MFSVPDQRRPVHNATSTQIWTRRLVILLTILAALALIAFLFWCASHIITTLLIFAVSSLIAYALAPAVEIFHRVMPRSIAILCVYLIAFVLLSLLFYIVINTAILQLTSLATNIGKLLTPGSNGADSPLVSILKRLGVTDAQLHTFAEQSVSQLTALAGTIAGGILPVLGTISSGVINIILTVVTSIYLMIDGSGAIRWLREQTPTSQRGRITTSIVTLQSVFGGYVRGQFTLCLVVSLMVGVGLAIIGMPYAVLLAVLSFVAEFIPVLGTIITGVISVLLALTQGWTMTILVLIYYVVVHILEGYVLAPRLVGKAVGLHPIISLLAFTMGAELFGPWGAIFASPLAGLIQALTATFWENYKKLNSDEFLTTNSDRTQQNSIP
jgi:predicted PurR-regulated permease PerM